MTDNIARLELAQEESAVARTAPPAPRWPVLGEEAIHGVAGRFLRKLEPHTEADPAGVLVQFLVMAAGDSGIIEVCQRRFGGKGSLVARLDFCHGLLALENRGLYPAAFRRNRWPASRRNRWPDSSEYAPVPFRAAMAARAAHSGDVLAKLPRVQRGLEPSPQPARIGVSFKVTL